MRLESVTPVVVGGLLAVVSLAAVLGLVGAIRGGVAVRRLLPWAFLTLSLVIVVVATLGTIGGGSDAGGINLTPFQEIRRGTADGVSNSVAINVWGNIGMFAPLGAMVVWMSVSPLLARIAMATVAGIGVSIAVEIVQLSLHRVADIDDVILNGAGALAGAIVAVVVVIVIRLARLIGRTARRVRRGTPNPPPG